MTPPPHTPWCNFLVLIHSGARPNRGMIAWQGLEIDTSRGEEHYARRLDLTRSLSIFSFLCYFSFCTGSFSYVFHFISFGSDPSHIGTRHRYGHHSLRGTDLHSALSYAASTLPWERLCLPTHLLLFQSYYQNSSNTIRARVDGLSYIWHRHNRYKKREKKQKRILIVLQRVFCAASALIIGCESEPEPVCQ